MASKQRVFIDIFLFVAGFVVISIPLFLISKAVPPVYLDAQRARIDYLSQNGKGIEAVTLGNSANLAIDFEKMGLRGYHLWFHGDDLFQLDTYLKVLKPDLPDLRVVFIPIGYESFQTFNNVSKSITSSMQKRFVLEYSTVADRVSSDNLKELLYSKIGFLVRLDHWTPVIIKARSLLDLSKNKSDKPSYIITEDGSIMRGRHEEFSLIKNIPSKNMQEKAYRRVQDKISSTRAILDEDPMIPEKSYQALLECIKRLNGQGLRVVLFKVPIVDIAEHMYQNKAPGKLALYREMLERLQFESDVEYYDFSGDHRMTGDYTLFRDPFHLNKKGAAIFSEKLGIAARLR